MQGQRTRAQQVPSYCPFGVTFVQIPLNQRSNSKHAMILADPLPKSADLKKGKVLDSKTRPILIAYFKFLRIAYAP